jgi:ribosome-associated protein
MLHRLGRKARGGVVVVEVSDTRSQWRNRAIARQRLAGLLGDAMRTTKRRRPTRAGAAVRRRRIESKKRRSETKRLRKRPEVD